MPDPEAIRDTLLRTVAIRAQALLGLAKTADEHGIVGWSEDDPPRPIHFPAYEVAQYMAAVTGITASDLRELRELGKMSPQAVDAAVNARKRLEDAKRGAES